jgi:hypothetical protein
MHGVREHMDAGIAVRDEFAVHPNPAFTIVERLRRHAILLYDRLLPIGCAGGIVRRNRVGFSRYCVSRGMSVNELAAIEGHFTFDLGKPGSFAPNMTRVCGAEGI